MGSGDIFCSRSWELKVFLGKGCVDWELGLFIVGDVVGEAGGVWMRDVIWGFWGFVVFWSVRFFSSYVVSVWV